MVISKEFETIGHLPGDIEAKFCAIDNVWVRQMFFAKKGDKNIPHKHLHDHATLLATGSVRATVEGQETVFKAPCMILVSKENYHFFEALENNTLAYCVHGIRDMEGTGGIIDVEMIPNGADVFAITQKYGPFSLGPYKELELS